MFEPKSEQELIDSRVQASHRTFEHEDTDILVSSSEATDLSVIARRFEEKCKQSSLKGLSSIIDGFGAVLRDTPHEHLESLRVCTFPGPQLGRRQAANSADHNQDVEQPLQKIELWRDLSTGRIMTSIAVRLHRSFNMRFKEAHWDGRPVVVQQIVFQMATTDVPPTGKAVVGGLVEEVHHLVTEASKILGKVCDGVRFEDVTTVPKLLTEALLRVVEPLTTSLKLDQVALSVVVGDDPVAITTTIASEQQPALKSAIRPNMHAITGVHLEMPPHTQARVKHVATWPTKR